MTIADVDPGSLPSWIAFLIERRQSLYSLVDQGVISALGVLTGISAARLMGIEEFGRFTLVMILLPVAQALQNAMLTAPMMSLAGTPRGRSRAFFAAALWASLAVTLPIALAVTALLAGFEVTEGKPVWTSLIASAGTLCVAQAMLFSVRRVLFALGRGVECIALHAVRGLILAIAFAAVLALGLPLHVDTLIWLLAASAAVPTAVAAWPIMREVHRVRRWRRVLLLIARCWPMGRWMLPTVGTTFAQEQAVWLLAGAMLGDAAVGGLRAAQYVVSLAYPVMASLENVVPARSSRTYIEGGFPALARSMVRTALAYAPVAIGFPLLAAMSSTLWLRLFFGPAYEGYGRCLEIFALVVSIVFLRDMTIYVFRAMNRMDVPFRAFVFSSLATIVVMTPLIRAAGTTGAASAIAAGQGLSLLYLLASLSCVHRSGRVSRATAA